MFAAVLRGGRLPHAILVEGPLSSENAAFARKIAGGMLCRNEDRPCGTCRDCVKICREIHPDVLVYGGDGTARSFHIDTVRKIRQEAFIRPNEAAGKVLILENAQTMSVQAQNALLKIIEEPPANVTFILTCENKASLLDTVLSRVRVFSLDPIEIAKLPETGELRAKAELLLDLLCTGSELSALAELAPYEKDRAGFMALLRELHSASVDRLLKMEKKGADGKRFRLQLLKLVAIIGEVDAAAEQNAGGLLLTAIVPALFRAP